jgi:hypothetical protein
MRSSVVIAGVAAVVAALLIGGWFLLGDREPGAAGASAPTPAPLTELTWPPDPSTSGPRPDPYPTVPSGQVQMGQDDLRVKGMRTAGNRLLIPVVDADCAYEEVWLLGEHGDRVEVEIRLQFRPEPGVTTTPGATYGCGWMSYGDGPYAAVELRAPLGDRRVVINRP